MSEAARSWSPLRGLLEDDDGRVEIRCARCGYGGVVVQIPARCPMCGSGASWQRRVPAVNGGRR